MTLSFIAGYTGELDPEIERCYTQQLVGRFTGKVKLAKLNDVHFFYGDQSESSNTGLHSGASIKNHQMLCFSADFREVPSGWRKGQESYADAILRGLEDSPLEYLNTLRGSFVMAWYHNGQLHLIRDRCGRFSLYHYHQRQNHYFAVEPQALIKLPFFKKSIDPGSVARYFTFSFQPGEHTMLRGLKKLKASTVLSFENGYEKSSLHYSHSERAESPWLATGDDTSIISQFNTSFKKAVARCSPNEANVGAFLSGGLDSSLVAAEVQAQRSTPLPTFALHFGLKYDNELSFAKEVAHFIGSEHHEIELKSKDMLAKISDLVHILNDPIGDPVTLGNYEMSRFLGKHHNIMFNGEGGDPCFGGPKNIPMMLGQIYQISGRPENWPVQQYLRSYHRAHQEWPRLLRKEWTDQICMKNDLESTIAPYFDRKHGVLLRKLLEINQCEKGAQLILPKVDQLQGSAGILAQSPLYDEDLVDYSMTLPTSLILKNGHDKIILKEIAKGRLPDSIIHRPKSGMRVPVYHWFRGPLKSFAKKILSKKRIREAGIFDEHRIHEILNMSTEESGSRYGIWLWMIITFEIWRIQTIENEQI